MRPFLLTAAALALLAGCSTTVAGSGSRVGDVTTAPATGSASATAPTASPTATPSASTSAAGGTDAPVPAPAQCASGSCPTAASVQLDEYQVLLRTGRSASGGPASVIELRHNGVAVDWHTNDDELPGGLACSSGRELTCVAVHFVGAHGSNATAWRRVGNALARGDTVTADTPQLFGRDLTGDGILDVVGLQNDFTPDYASGHVQWQTWVSDGTRLRSTGCTPLSAAPGPIPTAPVTGHCG
jgi:hypothetical protein